MLKDITLGQYFPGDTLAHRLDPRTKLILVVLYIVALFCAKYFVDLRSGGPGAGHLRAHLPGALSRPWSGGSSRC